MSIKLIKNNKTYWKLSFILPLLVIAGCGTSVLEQSANLGPAQLSSAPNQPDSRQMLMAKPIETYTFTARMVHKCWLNSVTPLIPNHVFFASATRKGGEKAHIGIHRRASLGRKGPVSFAIIFTTDGVGTSIATMNYKFMPAFAERLKTDVNRWTSGDPTCPPPVSLIEAADEQIPSPIPAQKSTRAKAKK